MPIFEINKPIATPDPAISVEGLPFGSHEFELVVVDDRGKQSLPARIKVLVRPIFIPPVPGPPIPGPTLPVPPIPPNG
ncbi:MAG TPA: hypothetical protein VFZ34_13185 [Blastocatellia bacterium]|nr:hypothetical protein [Blastocatellia bacterium]